MARIPTIGGEGKAGLVSVVIPTYNRAYIVPRAIESVLAQTYRPIEILVADDGSADDTRQCVERYGAPVRYLHQPNAGVSAARNLALRHARGEFIALLDSDDWWHEWKLAAQVAVLRALPQVGMVWTDMSAVDEGGRVLHGRYLRRMYNAHRHVRIERVCQFSGVLGRLDAAVPAAVASAKYYGGDFAAHMLLGNLVHTSTVLVRRERLAKTGGFDESLPIAGEDYDFHLRTCMAGPVAFIDESSIRYRVGAGDQLSADVNDVHMARNTLATLLRSLDLRDARRSLPKRVLQRRLARCHRWLGEAELGQGNKQEARLQLWRSFCFDVVQPRLLTLALASAMPGFLYRTARRGVAGLRGVRSTAFGMLKLTRLRPRALRETA